MTEQYSLPPDDEIGKYLSYLDGCSFSGGYLRKETDKGTIVISNFLPVPVEDIRLDDGNEQQRYFRIKGLKYDETKTTELPAVLVRASDAAAMNWVTENWGFGANIESPIQSRKDSLRSIMFRLGELFAVQKTIFLHTGWREQNGSYFFLHGGGAIGAENIEVRLDNRINRFDLSGEKINFISACNAFAELLDVASPEVVIPAVSLVFLSPLNEFFRQAGYEPSFVLYYLGRTQTHKSTFAALMLSFFGKFTATSLPSSFKDTANAIEKKGYILKDVLTVIDDYHPATTTKERLAMEQIMQSVSRGYGDRTGRDRMTSDITVRGGYAPRGNVIVTGEDFPSIGQSGSARNFIVELSPDAVPVTDKLNRAQQYAADGYFTCLMREYISWLIPQTDNLPEKLKRRFLYYREKAIEENNSGFGRTGDILAWLMTGFESLTEFLCDAHMIEKAEIVAMNDNAWKVLSSIAKKQLDKCTADTPTKMFLDTVREMFEAKKICVITIGGFPDTYGEMVGYRDTEFFYFLPSKIYGEVTKFFSQQNETFPLTKSMLFRQLRNEKILVPSGNDNTVQKRIEQKNGKYLCIPREFIELECGDKSA